MSEEKTETKAPGACCEPEKMPNFGAMKQMMRNCSEEFIPAKMRKMMDGCGCGCEPLEGSKADS